MKSTRGGARPGAGRKKGSLTRRTQELLAKAVEAGITPLDYMLERMRDVAEEPKVRQAMAVGAAPYVHARLAAVEHSGGLDLGISKCSDAELDERMGQAAAEAAVIVVPAGKGAAKPA